MELDKYQSLYVSLKSNDEQLTFFSNESFRDIMDYLNEGKFIMLFDLVDGIYLPLALNIDDISAIYRGKEL
ncbi:MULTISPECIES: hypothetical protein [Bacillus cereus group]|uniref:hypothetical protein n=1 Tax=Bacillus cereus group TaxID=86661 RepID=UPI000B42E47A|nr:MULTISPECIES: hypothetical protein [Bacillus cereus group]MED3022350.1 hypothetical protein [Bacillus wiedmannii]OTX94448.1 hypothetical protein BK729_29745 [Bacillus thuringiensis serovar wratislaviensis]OUB56210.1 hypothetical protein BK743_21140 [Bacillus thuringiensis serovar sylvestriensis]